MLEIVALIALWVGTFIILMLHEDPPERAIAYATFLTLSVSGIFFLSTMVLPWPYAVVALSIFGLLLLKGEDLFDAICKAAIISRLFLLVAIGALAGLPIAATMLIAHLVHYWYVYMVLAIPGIVIAVWLEWLIWGPTIRVYYDHYLRA